MKVSILVPVYNAEKYIERCAVSLFGQTYGDIEFVFVNDCSTDKSIDILKSVAKRYPARCGSVKIVSHEANRGVAAARNTLLDNATGEYLLWVDADDFINTYAVETLVRKAENMGADIVCFGTVVISALGTTKLPLQVEYSSEKLIVSLLANRIPTALWGKLMKRSLLIDNHIAFIDGLNLGEDLLVLVKAAYFAKIIANDDTALYYYDKTNDQSITHVFSIEKTFERSDMVVKILDEIDCFLSGKLDVNKFIVSRKLDAYLSMIYCCLLKKDRSGYEKIRLKISELNIKDIKTSRSRFYKFFLLCDNYFINLCWAYMMHFLRFVLMKFDVVMKGIKAAII